MFAASFVAGALLNQVSQFVREPGTVLTVLGTGAPQTASFFITYILLNVRPWCHAEHVGLGAGPRHDIILSLNAGLGPATTTRTCKRVRACVPHPSTSFAFAFPRTSVHQRCKPAAGCCACRAW